MANVPAVPGFDFDEALGAYVLTANRQIAIEVIHHGRLAPKSAWVATFNGEAWHMVEAPMWGEAAALAGEILAHTIPNWPSDWAIVA